MYVHMYNGKDRGSRCPPSRRAWPTPGQPVALKLRRGSAANRRAPPLVSVMQPNAASFRTSYKADMYFNLSRGRAVPSRIAAGRDGSVYPIQGAARGGEPAGFSDLQSDIRASRRIPIYPARGARFLVPRVARGCA